MKKSFGIRHAFTLLTTLTSFKSNRIFFFLKLECHIGQYRSYAPFPA